MRVSKKHAPLITATLMGLVMTFVLSFVGAAFNYGFKAGFVVVWLSTFPVLFVFAVPVIVFTFPVVRKIVAELTAD